MTPSSPGRRSPQICQRLFQLSVSSSPYFYYLSLASLLGILGYLVARFRRTALDPLTRNALMLISGLMLLSSIAAEHKGEAFLQLANFLPFFLFFAFLPYLLNSVAKLEQMAIALVLSTVPINLVSLGEYVLKNIDYPRSMRKTALVQWVRSMPHTGRAMVMFDHPNALASYLVLVLGLGLGLILKYTVERRALRDRAPSWRQIPLWLIYGATYLNLLGIFCSGSRNGFLVAVTQLIAFSLCVKGSRFLMLTGMASLAVVVASAAFLGIGGRALSIASWTDDPRVAVWQLALDFMQQRPWLGWGLGNFKLLYPPHAISADYPYIYHPHNFWLLLGTETGLPVMVLLTLVVGYACYRTARPMAAGAIAPPYRALLLGYYFAFWGCVAFALLDVTFYDARINVLNWVILAGIYAATAPNPKTPPPPLPE